MPGAAADAPAEEAPPDLESAVRGVCDPETTVGTSKLAMLWSLFVV